MSEHEEESRADRMRDRLFTGLEGLAVFVLGFVLMHVAYAATVSTPGAEIGVPGHDSFYHITMASLLPKLGAMSEFPWLEYTWFRDQGDAFVSHHWGFHLLLVPFVKAAEMAAGDALAGGRWATSAVFGANLLLFHLLLRQRRVPFHWLWIALVFLLPDQFLARHGFVRAIGASFLFIQLTLLALFARRYWLAALSVGAYVHLYLGAVMFGPLLVAIYTGAQALGPKDDRRIPWKMVALTAAAWSVGVVTYPYAGGIFEFLRLQVFGTGLSPDIEVGREWKPYTDAWFLITMAAPLLAVWVGALVLRLRSGPRLSAEETTVLVLQFLFLMLTFKARRFIEYWPPLCLLSAAYLAAPPLVEIRRSVGRWIEARSASRRLLAHVVAVAALGVAAALAWSGVDFDGDAAPLLDRWQLWVAPVLLLVALGIMRGWRRERDTALAGGGRPLVGLARAAAVILVGVLLPAAAMATGARGYASSVRQLRCYYDLDALESMMGYLKEHSRQGDVVFTDDWDVFPPFFYHNRHNHYIVGLDPKFTHERAPDLWNRYVKISRGQVPSTIRLASSADGSDRATVALEDIREHFRARYVIADRDHRDLADALAAAPELAEFVYPSSSYEDARDAPYLVFRIRAPDERVEPADVATGGTSPVYLSELRPVSVSQGWGDLGSDRTVDGNTIRLDGRSYARGLGTHAPSRLLYEIPEGFGWLEATVGIDDETGGRGSATASIVLDGRTVYRSPVLRGGAAPVVVRIPVEEARQVQLETRPTEDGQSFDHVSWADVRLLPVGGNEELGARNG